MKNPATLPCPFCGSKPKFHHIPKGDALPEIDHAYWSLSCQNLSCTAEPMSFGGTKAEAAINWNTRVPTCPTFQGAA
jgi:hypothetical protein